MRSAHNDRDGREPVDDTQTAAAKRLLDDLRAQGFAFERIGPGEDGPVRGVRDSIAYRDEIYLGGFSDSCFAQRRTRRSITVPGGLPVTSRVEGDALTVLHGYMSWPRSGT